MNVENIKLIIEDIRREPERLNMACWECNTYACVGGFVRQRFYPREPRERPERIPYTDMIADAFDITLSQASELSTGWTEAPTVEETLDMLQTLADTGRVEWPTQAAWSGPSHAVELTWSI